MKKLSSTGLTIVLVLAIVILTGCARQEEIAAVAEAKKVMVMAGAGKELCFAAKKDDEVVFRFEADRELKFNLHYHIGDEVFYPVPEHSTAAEKGQYFIPKDETYCLMWTNDQDVDVGLAAELQGVDDAAWF